MNKFPFPSPTPSVQPTHDSTHLHASFSLIFLGPWVYIYIFFFFFIPLGYLHICARNSAFIQMTTFQISDKFTVLCWIGRFDRHELRGTSQMFFPLQELRASVTLNMVGAIISRDKNIWLIGRDTPGRLHCFLQDPLRITQVQITAIYVKGSVLG